MRNKNIENLVELPTRFCPAKWNGMESRITTSDNYALDFAACYQNEKFKHPISTMRNDIVAKLVKIQNVWRLTLFRLSQTPPKMFSQLIYRNHFNLYFICSAWRARLTTTIRHVFIAANITCFMNLNKWNNLRTEHVAFEKDKMTV